MKVESLDDLFRACGGRKAVQERIGCGRSTLTMWRHNGIPPRHMPALADMACKNSGVALSGAEMARLELSATPPPDTQGGPDNLRGPTISRGGGDLLGDTHQGGKL